MFAPRGFELGIAIRRPAQGQRQLRLGAALHPPLLPRHASTGGMAVSPVATAFWPNGILTAIRQPKSPFLNMIAEFLKSLLAKNLPGNYRPALAALAELSCSPWKFDVLWDLWPELKPSPDHFPQLAEQLLSSAKSRSEAVFGAVAFDDLTIFYDIVGPHQESRSYSRTAYRLAYLSIRHMIFRSELGAPPTPPFALTEERYFERLAIVGCLVTGQLMPEIRAVLSAAEERYRERGKIDGAALCAQNRRILEQLHSSELLEAGVAAFGQQALDMMMSANHAALASEIALQWWPIFGEDFYVRIAAKNPGDSEVLDAIRDFASMLKRLAPFAWLNEQRPGLGSVMATLSLLRLEYQLEPPACLRDFDVNWIGRCQESVIWLRDHWKREPSIPKDMLNALLDFFVKSGHISRHFTSSDHDSTGHTAETMKAAAILMADVMTVARLRARNELSHDDYVEQLDQIKPSASSVPFAVENFLLTGSSLSATDPTLSRAVLEATLVLARLSKNKKVTEMVESALPTTDYERDLERAERFERQGRPDMSVVAWQNAGSSLMEAERYADALEAFERAWALVGKIFRQEVHIPTTTVFPRASTTLQVARNYAMGLWRCGKFQEGLNVIDTAITHINFARCLDSTQAQPMDDALARVSDDFESSRLVELHIFASECLQHLHRNEEALARMKHALALCTEQNNWSDAATIHIKFATFEERGSPQQVDHLAKARRYGESERRAQIYELDKVKVATSLQAAYVWAGESLVEQGRTWEALAAFEGLRGRSFLDLLGISSALEMPTSLTEAERNEGAQVLNSIRSIAYPGEGQDVFGMRVHWERAIKELDEWLDRVSLRDHQYKDIVRGSTLAPADLQKWACSVERPTAVIHWFLGEEYSYVSILTAHPTHVPVPPVFRRISGTLSSLSQAAMQLQACVHERQNPPAALLHDLSQALLDPVADLLEEAEVVYLCPTQCLHSIPLAALSLAGQPLNCVKEVAIVPSLSILRVLERFAKAETPHSGACVFGPEFPHQANRVAQMLSTTPAASILGQSGAPAEIFARANAIHLICHGRYDSNDPWNSGFEFSMPDETKTVLEGRVLARWRLRSKIAVLEACDTRRQVVTVTDDGFGIGRFLHMAGVPTILLADWEVRNDVSLRFMKEFYDALPHSNETGNIHGVGGAYRAAIRKTRSWVGAEQFFLWAPFTLVGVVR